MPLIKSDVFSSPDIRYTGFTARPGGSTTQRFEYQGRPGEIDVPHGGDIYQAVADYINNLYKNGFVLNSNTQITPEVASDFLAQAQNEINPYYSGQLKLAREMLLRSVGYKTDEILRQEQDYERKYGLALRTLGEQEAERGFALSGIRQREEKELAAATQRDIESERRKLSFDVGNLQRTFAEKYGQPELPTSNIPTYPRVLPGESNFKRSEETTPLYELSPEVYQGLIGSSEFERRGAVRERASGLEEAARTLGTLPPAPSTTTSPLPSTPIPQENYFLRPGEDLKDYKNRIDRLRSISL